MTAKTAFISHSTKNKDTADNVVASLEQNGISCWIAPRDINAGINYGAAISIGIQECDVLVLVYSEDSNVSGAVVREVQMAFECRKHIIPLRISSVPVSNELSFFLSGIQWVDATPQQTNFDKLATDIRILLNNPQRVSTPNKGETELLLTFALDEDDNESTTLTLIDADDPSKFWVVDLQNDVVIGRTTRCCVQLSEPSVSREQCKLYKVGKIPTIENLSRSNITQLNDQLILQPFALKHGDRIKCGRVTLKVE
ncbi:MAG: TIR domain-containing protein [Defluviitaleaceae bacterium]|nr:TIR domain-containing protein [Defluviitaleaceae bacterium]